MRILVGVCALFVCASVAAADPSGCKYGKRDGFEAGECDPATGEKSMTLVLKKGDTNTCPPTKEVRRPCRARASKNMAGEPSCRYELDEELSEDCDPATGMRTLQMTLVDGNPEVCPTTKTTTRKCEKEGKGRRKNKGRKGANKKGKGRGRIQEEECKYQPERDTEDDDDAGCDPATSTKAVTMTLKAGNPDTCPPTKTVTKECVPAGCVYTPGEWSECVDGVEEATRQDTLQSSATGMTCKPTVTRSRTCKKMAKIEERKEAKKEARKEKQEARQEAKEKKNKMKSERREERRQERKQAKKEARKEQRRAARMSS